MCMDNFTNYVFLKCYNGSINCVIGELLGLDAWPYPADQEAANAEFVAALDKWAGLYLASGPFICGEELTIADYRAVGLLFTIMQPKIKEKTGLSAGTRLSIRGPPSSPRTPRPRPSSRRTRGSSSLDRRATVSFSPYCLC